MACEFEQMAVTNAENVKAMTAGNVLITQVMLAGAQAAFNAAVNADTAAGAAVTAAQIALTACLGGQAPVKPPRPRPHRGKPKKG